MNDKSEIQSYKIQIESSIEEHYSKINFQYYNPYNINVLDPIRIEICKCISIGCFQAAITLTNFLFETSLKTSLVYRDLIPKKLTGKAYNENFSLAMDLYDHKHLYETIELAFNKNLLKEDQKQELENYKNKFRNPYSHAQKRKIFKGEKTEIGEVKKNEEGYFIEDYEVDRSDEFLFQGLFQSHKAETEAIPYFKAIDRIIRQIILVLDELKKTYT
jgi:hypothetical protein